MMPISFFSRFIIPFKVLLILSFLLVSADVQTALAARGYPDKLTSSIGLGLPVNTAEDLQELSIDIFGLNFASKDFMKEISLPFRRWGGNSTSRYDWQKGNTHTGIVGDCELYPANNIWNARVDNLPINSNSDAWINSIGRTTGFHMDFGSGTWAGGQIGIPYNIANGTTDKVTFSFYYPDESDPGPYPIPASPAIEYGSDHHILIVDSISCKLYEIYDASYSNGGWHAGSGAIWDLNTNVLRPDTWTSADAAGLPILPGLTRYEEVLSGQIDHALRFTAYQTNGYIWPARHLTSDDPGSPGIPPMGARFRLKASFDISGFNPQMQVILTAMKNYGIILADNGSDWYVSGAPNPGWDNDILHTLDVLTGDDFEALDTSVLMLDRNSGEVNTSGLIISGNAGIGGASLSYLDGTSKTATADASGRFTIRVSSNWSGSIIPSRAGVASFTPAFHTYSNITTYLSGQNFRANYFKVIKSTALYDGYILESSENSGVGGTLNSTSNLLLVGDNALNRQYRAILSFATGVLPDTAMIVSAQLKVKKQAIKGIIPFTAHGLLVMDIRKLFFGNSITLNLNDFNASGLNNAGRISSASVGNVYMGTLTPGSFSSINTTGTTQLRLRFKLDDDNDKVADSVTFFSGNDLTAANRPSLEILYYVP